MDVPTLSFLYIIGLSC